MSREQKKTSRVLAVLMLLIYIPLLIPFIYGQNLENVGIVTDSKILPINTFPIDIQDVLNSQKEDIAVLVVENKIMNKKWAILSEGEVYPENTVVEITDKRIDWYVDWRNYDFINQPFYNLVIGDVEEAGSFDSFIESMVSSGFGQLLYILSALNFFIGGFLFVFSLNILSGYRFALWNVPAVLACYSFEIFLTDIVVLTHRVEGEPISVIMLGIGFLFIILAPITIISWKYESSVKRHKGRIKKTWRRS